MDQGGDQLRIADLATGSGDIPRLIVDFARDIRADVRVDAADQQESTLEIGKKLSSRYPEISFIQANVLEWDPADRYDIVCNNLALHHFSEENAVRLLRRCRELSRKRVLVTDLRRGWVATAGVYLITATVYRDPMTKIDGRLSAERAFRFRKCATSPGERSGKTSDKRNILSPDRRSGCRSRNRSSDRGFRLRSRTRRPNRANLRGF